MGSTSSSKVPGLWEIRSTEAAHPSFPYIWLDPALGIWCPGFVVQVLRAAELPDCAYAYVQACQEAGLLIPQPMQQQQQGPQVSRSSSSQAEDDGLFDQQQQQEQQPALELFDILGLRTRMLLQSSTSRVALGGSTTAAGDASSGPELLQLIRSEYNQYLADLMGSL